MHNCTHFRFDVSFFPSDLILIPFQVLGSRTSVFEIDVKSSSPIPARCDDCAEGNVFFECLGFGYWSVLFCAPGAF